MENEIREKIMEILADIKPGPEYDICTTLIDDEELDSFAIISLVGELSDEFEVDITLPDIIPDNFNSVDAMTSMILRLQDED